MDKGRGVMRFRYRVCKEGYGRHEDAPPPTATPKRGSAAWTILGSVDRDPAPRLCAKGETFDVKEIALGEGQILSDLLSMGDGPDDVLAFVSKWGLLFAESAVEEDLFFTLKHQLNRWMDLAKKSGSAEQDLAKKSQKSGSAELLKRLTPKLARAQIEAIRADDGETTIGIYLQHIQGFLLLEMCLKFDGAVQIAECANPKCRRWYVRKPKAPHTAHCSPPCRQAAWRASHANAPEADRLPT
jgi:hypothetical protein